MKQLEQKTITKPKPRGTTSQETRSKKHPTKTELRRLLRKVGPILRGESAIDLDKLRVECTTIEDAERVLNSYGISPGDATRIEAIRTEAIEFIQEYFLKDQELCIPEEIASPTVTAADLILLASSTQHSDQGLLLQRWACALLRVMHTVYHLTDDIRFKYIHQIQQQIIDKFREHIYQDTL
ncbi:MAG: hypothetical protein ACE5JO_09690, partial [Candidatus Binatia bacterium]